MQNGTRALSGGTEKLYVLRANVVTWLFVFVKAQTVQVKQAYCIAYKLYSISVQLFVTLWTVAHQAPLSMEFSGQEYWSG